MRGRGNSRMKLPIALVTPLAGQAARQAAEAADALAAYARVIGRMQQSTEWSLSASFLPCAISCDALHSYQ